MEASRQRGATEVVLLRVDAPAARQRGDPHLGCEIRPHDGFEKRLAGHSVVRADEVIGRKLRQIGR